MISDQWNGPGSLQQVAALMGVTMNDLHRALLFRSFAAARGRQSITMVPLSLIAANENCEALTKEMYSKLFSWIVQRINAASAGDMDRTNADSSPGGGGGGGGGGDGEESARAAGTMQPSSVVGLLDIFGFEIFEHNSFEQFCINYANEKLHKHYLDVAFMNELSVYKKEGVMIDTQGVMPNFSGVSALLDKKPTGMLWMLSEEMRIPRGTSTTWFHKIKKRFGKNGTTPSKVVVFDPIDDSPQFVVRHFAGLVTYDHLGFMEKNRDSMEPTLIDLMRTSKFQFVQDLFAETKKEKKKIRKERESRHGRQNSASAIAANSATSTKKSRHGRTNSASAIAASSAASTKKEKGSIALQFRAQLRNLMTRIESADVQFVRCIKPNTSALNAFDARHVLQQLNYSGIGELLEFRKQGYPFRYTYKQFVSKYLHLLRRRGSGSTQHREEMNLEKNKLVCREILQLLATDTNFEGYRHKFGASMIFLDGAMDSSLRRLHSTLRIAAVVLIQTRARGMLVRRKNNARMRVVRDYPRIVLEKNRNDLIAFVREHVHHLSSAAGSSGFTVSPSLLSTNSFLKAIHDAKLLQESICTVEDGAQEVRRILQRMQDPTLRVRPSVLENALLQIQSTSSKQVDGWLSADIKETVKIGMNYVLRVQTLASLRKAVSDALVNGDTMEAEMSLSILEHMTDSNTVWKEVIDARETIENITREQDIAVPLLIAAMNHGDRGGGSTLSQEKSDSSSSDEKRTSLRTSSLTPSGGGHNTISFEVSAGGDEAHALDVAVIQATRVGIITTAGKHCIEAAKILRDLKRETSLSKKKTNWKKVTLLLSKASLVNAQEFAPSQFQLFVDMLDQSETMDELATALSKGGALKLVQIDEDGHQYNLNELHIEPLKTHLRVATSMGMGMTNQTLMSSALIVLRVREAQSRSEWREVEVALKDADVLKQVHPSVVIELKIAKEALGYWKKLESEAAAGVDQSFLLTTYLPNGSTHDATVWVSGAQHRILMREGHDDSKQKFTEAAAATKSPKTTQTSIGKGIEILTKNIHTMIVGASNKRMLTMMTERNLTAGTFCIVLFSYFLLVDGSC